MASEFVAVSAYTAAQWLPVNGIVPVIANGIDLAAWSPGTGGEYAVWSGRIVPEKGLTAGIVAARRAGFPVRFPGRGVRPRHTGDPRRVEWAARAPG